MMMRAAISLSVALVMSWPAEAQVLEIGSDGSVQTFDRPTVFKDGDAAAIAPAKTDPVADGQTATLLTEAAIQRGLDPGLLLSVARQESGFKARSVSSAGAIGVLQLMPATAAELGVDPNDVTQNIRGGAAYLRRQLDRFGSVPLALAAYNAGPGAVIRYHGIPPFAETQAYVSRIMRRWHPAARTAVSFNILPEVIEVP